jgi:hypothetical protein
MLLKRKLVMYILISIIVVLVFNNYHLNKIINDYERDKRNTVHHITRSYNFDSVFNQFDIILNEENPSNAKSLSDNIYSQINLIQGLIKLEESFYDEEYLNLFYESILLDETALYFSNLSSRTELTEVDLFTINGVYNSLKKLDKTVLSSITHTIHSSTVNNPQALLYAYYQYAVEFNELLKKDK